MERFNITWVWNLKGHCLTVIMNGIEFHKVFSVYSTRLLNISIITMPQYSLPNVIVPAKFCHHMEYDVNNHSFYDKKYCLEM